MYKLVETVAERTLFDVIYKEAFAEKNYELDDDYTGERYSYLVKNKEGKFAGTIEVAPFKPLSGNSILHNPKHFLSYPEVTEAIQTMWEIDKVTVKKLERKNGTLDNIIEAIGEITSERGITHLVGEMNPIFCRALKIEYKLNVIRAGTIMRTDTYPYIPTIIPMKSILAEYEANRSKQKVLVTMGESR